jgi:hypothetical protein
VGPPGKNFSNHHCSLIFSSKDVVTSSRRINFNYSAHTINWLIAQSIERYHSSRSLALGRHVPKQIINIHSYLPDSSSLLPLFPSHRLCGGPSCPLPWLHGMRNFQVNFAYTRLSYIDISHTSQSREDRHGMDHVRKKRRQVSRLGVCAWQR